MILLFFANKLDAHDNRKLMTVSLVDNSPKDRQKYYITLETGFRRGAGTTAKVVAELKTKLYIASWETTRERGRLEGRGKRKERLKGQREGGVGNDG